MKDLNSAVFVMIHSIYLGININKPYFWIFLNIFTQKKEPIMKNSLNKIQIELIAYDFDGVLTDNKVYLSEDGVESVDETTSESHM